MSDGRAERRLIVVAVVQDDRGRYLLCRMPPVRLAEYRLNRATVRTFVRLGVLEEPA